MGSDLRPQFHRQTDDLVEQVGSGAEGQAELVLQLWKTRLFRLPAEVAAFEIGERLAPELVLVEGEEVLVVPEDLTEERVHVPRLVDGEQSVIQVLVQVLPHVVRFVPCLADRRRILMAVPPDEHIHGGPAVE